MPSSLRRQPVPLPPEPDAYDLQREIDRIDQNARTLETGPAIELHLMLVQKNQLPDNLIPLDGRAVSRKDNPRLFKFWGTQYGAGDGSTTFNVPDMRGLVPVGALEGETVGNEKVIGTVS